jgi:hypothetical protein
MEPHQKLDVFLPRLRAELVRNGMSEEAAAFVCKAVLAGAQQPAITTLKEYQEAWTVCHAMEEILTTLDDGSEAAACCTAFAHATIDFEVAYVKQHGHQPLNASPPEITDGPKGSA